MFEGTIISINIAPAAEAPMESVGEARAVPGKGLQSDRYFARQGSFYKPQPDRELTLIESEAIEAFRTEFKLEFDLSSSRRNRVHICSAFHIPRFCPDWCIVADCGLKS